MPLQMNYECIQKCEYKVAMLKFIMSSWNVRISKQDQQLDIADYILAMLLQ